MAHRVFKWSRLLPITALLVVTTGVAAAPIRQAWLPIVARPFGLNFGTMPAATPTQIASNAGSEANVRRDNIELEATLTNAPDRLQMLASSTSQTSASAGQRSELALDAAAEQVWAKNHRGGNSHGGSLVGSGGGFGGFAGSGGLLGSRAAPSAGPPSSYSRTDSRSGGNGGGGSASNVSGGGSGGGSGSGGAAGAAPGGGTTADGIFKDYKSGLPELGGKGNKDNGGGGGGSNHGGRKDGVGPKLASNPEPSSILLFGTGLVAVAGAVRRRFRR